MASTLTAKQLKKLAGAILQCPKQAPAPKRKISPKSRRARKAAHQVQMVGSNGSGAGGFQELPYARQYSDFNMNRFIVKNTRDRIHGDGIVVVGTEALANVVTAAAAADFFTGSVGTAASVNLIRVSPDAFNGRLALQARNYGRYRFTQLRLHFVPALGTANPGLAAVGYVPDGDQDAVATQTFASTSQMKPSMVFSLNFPCSLELIRGYHTDPELYYVEQDAATIAGLRQTCQGQIVGFPSSNTLGVLTQGLIVAEYTCELYYPTTDYGFTVSLRSLEEKEAVRSMVSRLRKAALDEDEEWDRHSVGPNLRRK